MTLERLLVRAGVPRWHQYQVFGNAALVDGTLWMPDADLAGMVTRCYLPQLSVEYGSSITVKVGTSPLRAVAPKPAGSAFKKAYRGQIEKLHQGDML